MILETIVRLLQQIDSRQQRLEERQVRMEMKLDSVQLLPPAKIPPHMHCTKLYAISTAAKMLGVSPATVRRYADGQQVVNVERLRIDINTVREAL